MKRKYSDTSNENLYIPMTSKQWDIVDFIAFESETSSIYPFAVAFDDLTMDMVDAIIKLCDDNTDDTEVIYAACENFLGINPEMKMK